MHIKYYIAVHIWKDKWWLLRPLVISLLCNSDDLVDEESSPGSFVQPEETKYFGLIFNISILFSCHCRYMYYHLISSKQSLLYIITFSSTPTCISNIIFICCSHLKRQMQLLRPPFISSLWISDDLVPASSTTQQQQSKCWLNF